jgi:hypothetical protein
MGTMDSIPIDSDNRSDVGKGHALTYTTHVRLTAACCIHGVDDLLEHMH